MIADTVVAKLVELNVTAKAPPEKNLMQVLIAGMAGSQLVVEPTITRMDDRHHCRCRRWADHRGHRHRAEAQFLESNLIPEAQFLKFFFNFRFCVRRSIRVL